MPRLLPMEAAAQRIAGSPSQPRSARQLSQRESPWHGGKVSSFARASPFGRGVTAGDGEGEDAYEGQAVFVLTFLTEDVPSPHCRAAMTERVPSREKVDRENPQIFPIYKL